MESYKIQVASRVAHEVVRMCEEKKPRHWNEIGAAYRAVMNDMIALSFREFDVSGACAYENCVAPYKRIYEKSNSAFDYQQYRIRDCAYVVWFYG